MHIKRKHQIDIELGPNRVQIAALQQFKKALPSSRIFWPDKRDRESLRDL